MTDDTTAGLPALKATYSTVAAAEIARAVEETYALGAVAFCELIRRGFNDVYEVRFESGGRCVARLAGLRARGPCNSAYEGALLAHLQSEGVAVGAALPNAEGALWRVFAAPEGARTLMLFRWLDGAPPRANLDDVALMGRGLALIHTAGPTYGGPPSRYGYSLEALRGGGLARLLAAPTMDEAARASISGLMTRLDGRLAQAGALTQVTCHGDCHGGNTFMAAGADGVRVAGFFDFDDAGPGPLAFDLAVYLWAHLQQTGGAVPQARSLAAWEAFITGYRTAREIPPADFAAIASFVSFRHLWFMGEYASRVSEWGMTALSPAWIAKQVELLEAWETLETPPV